MCEKMIFCRTFFFVVDQEFFFTVISRIFSYLSVVFCTTKIKNKEGTFSPSFLIPFSPFPHPCYFLSRSNFLKRWAHYDFNKSYFFGGFRNRIRNWEWRRINSSLFLVSTISPFSLYLVWDNNQGSFQLKWRKMRKNKSKNQKSNGNIFK